MSLSKFNVSLYVIVAQCNLVFLLLLDPWFQGNFYTLTTLLCLFSIKETNTIRSWTKQFAFTAGFFFWVEY